MSMKRACRTKVARARLGGDKAIIVNNIFFNHRLTGSLPESGRYAAYLCSYWADGAPGRVVQISIAARGYAKV